MRRIISAISVLALAFSLVASATSANAAVAGYDSAYAGESAFLNLTPGQSGTFTVFFANTGSTSWVKGSASQVDLAACLVDKVTCNQQEASDAPFNSGWLSATRYATHAQSTVAPGGIGTFSYDVKVPAGQAAATYRFNGALVLSSSGADIRNEGYYQDVTVTAAPAGTAGVITSIAPITGSVAGGTTVTITGTGFVCTPTFPTVNFGANAATVTSCGATSIVATSPAGAAGAVQVTETNSGAAASNGVTYTYADTTRPTYNSVTASGTIAVVTFSEAVCRNAVYATGDWSATVNGAVNAPTGDNLPTCNSSASNGVTTANVFLTTAAPNGSFVAVTLETQGGAKLRDAAGNLAVAPRSNTTTATAADTTAPTLTGASGNGGSTTLTLTFSEPVFCADPLDAGDVTAGTIASTATNTCGATSALATTSFTVTLASALAANTSYTVTLTTTAGETADASGNNIASPATTTFTSGASDTTSPTLTDTKVVTNAGSTTNMDSGDVFTITFSEAMNTTTLGDTITVQDTDNSPSPGDTGTITCGASANATCVFSAGGTILTVTITNVVGTGTVGYPATITSLGGFSDAAGNGPNLAGSADRVIDVE